MQQRCIPSTKVSRVMSIFGPTIGLAPTHWLFRFWLIHLPSISHCCSISSVTGSVELCVRCLTTLSSLELASSVALPLIISPTLTQLTQEAFTWLRSRRNYSRQHLAKVQVSLHQTVRGLQFRDNLPSLTDRTGFGPATAQLGALSFRLHRELAEQHQGFEQWGYSRSTGTSLAQTENPSNVRGDDWLRDGGSRAQVAAIHEFNGPSNGPAWLRVKHGEILDTISTDDSVGQV